jgi:hypothetical protein
VILLEQQVEQLVPQAVQVPLVDWLTYWEELPRNVVTTRVLEELLGEPLEGLLQMEQPRVVLVV